MLLISIPEYDLEMFSDNLLVWSVTEPVFFVKQHGCTIFWIETRYELTNIGIFYSNVYFQQICIEITSE